MKEGIILCFVFGSFNIQYFSGDGLYRKNGTPENTNPVGRNLDAIADIILNEKFDIIALQEVMDYMAVTKLVRIINFKTLDHWECYHGMPPVCKRIEIEETEDDNKNGKLGFGFLWNTRRFNLCSSSDGVPILPSIINIPTCIKRNPLYGRFIPTNLPKVEIRLINVHLRSSGYMQEKLGEFKTIMCDIYNMINSGERGDNRSIYTFVLGDYNLQFKRCNRHRLTEPNLYITDTYQEAPTTLSRQNKQYTNNDFDHFDYGGKIFDGVVISPERVDAVSKYSNGFEEYLKTISDHVPIKIILNLNPRR